MKYTVTQKDQIYRLPTEPRKLIKNLVKNPFTVGNVRCTITAITYDDGKDDQGNHVAFPSFQISATQLCILPD